MRSLNLGVGTKMKCIIAGSRVLGCRVDLVDKAIRKCGFGHEITEIVSGGAQGIDAAGEIWARANDYKLTIMPADWNLHGKSAGYKRNVAMSEYVGKDGACIVIMAYGGTHGSQHMVDIANHRGIKVFELIETAESTT